VISLQWKAPARINWVVEKNWQIGDTVRIEFGPFQGWIGKIVSIDTHQLQVKVMLLVFGAHKTIGVRSNEIASV
jgi:transcription antitermination factor NusG